MSIANEKLASASRPTSATILLSCPDCEGIVFNVSKFVSEHQGNIIDLEEHVDRAVGVLLMRVEWDLARFDLEDEQITEAFSPLAERFQMKWTLHFSNKVPRMAIFVSKAPHCLYDILARFQSKEWNVEIPLIVSNHEDLRPVAESFGIDYHVLPITKATKQAQEARQIALLNEHEVDFVVLARYMQILSRDFVSAFSNRIINIHHSFLPAFPGAKPYHSAFKRGVKIIGATSHYVTSELDAGPIIEQDITRITHGDSVEDLIRKGKDLEKVVLARAIWHHLQHRILVYENRTVVLS